MKKKLFNAITIALILGVMFVQTPTVDDRDCDNLPPWIKCVYWTE